MLSMSRQRVVILVFGLALALVTGMACAPTLDWRDIRPEGTLLQLQFPCKPGQQRRELTLAGVRVTLALHACAAGGLTWGLAVADLRDPALVSTALVELATTAAAKLGAPEASSSPLRVSGATPSEASGLQRLEGRLPDGGRIQMHVAVFSHGTHVYQATVLGERVAEESAQVYFLSLRLNP